MTSRHRTAISRSTLLAIFLALVGCLGLTATTSAASATPSAASATTTPYCGIDWGSLPKSGNLGYGTEIVNVRSGQHDCYDRLVVDLRGGISTAYQVSYVDAVYNDARGDVVSLRGGARLKIVAYSLANDYTGAPTYVPANSSELTNVSGYRTFRQVAWAGSFESQTTIGLGVRARLPFRVFVLGDPGTGSRLVIDVAHLW